ncbi:MAG: hypothetical protein WKF75_04275 [Singulisphaera sp.]
MSPLDLEVREAGDRPGPGDVMYARTAPDVQVKVIGSANAVFLSGRTDLRGVFAAEGVRGQVTAVARKGTGQFAFHRGAAVVAGNAGSPVPTPSAYSHATPSLDEHFRSQNKANQGRRIDQLQRRHHGMGGGGMGGGMGGMPISGFK